MSSQAMGLLVTAFLLSLTNAQLIFPTEPNVQAINTQNLGECTTPNQGRGQCIRVLSCTSIFALLERDIPSDNDINNLRQSQCGTRNGQILVCCPVQITPQQPNRTESGNILPQPGICGTGNTDRIYGGNSTKINEFPWMALLGYSKGYHCSGVLINNRYVLTAAKCLAGEPPYLVRLGEWDTTSLKDCENGDCSPLPLDITIEQWIKHENSNPSGDQSNDIALLRLSQEVPYSYWIKPICLPVATHLQAATFDGFDMDVGGWRQTENDSRNRIKVKTRVNGVDHSKCTDDYKRDKVIIQDSQICAVGVSGTDACQIDSSSPLMGLDKSGHVPYFYLAGISSFGSKACVEDNFPVVYTRVGSYIDWIQNNIQP